MIFSGLSTKPFYEVSAERVAVADIETLGQGVDAVICSIAVVVVDLIAILKAFRERLAGGEA